DSVDELAIGERRGAGEGRRGDGAADPAVDRQPSAEIGSDEAEGAIEGGEVERAVDRHVEIAGAERRRAVETDIGAGDAADFAIGGDPPPAERAGGGDVERIDAGAGEARHREIADRELVVAAGRGRSPGDLRGPADRAGKVEPGRSDGGDGEWQGVQGNVEVERFAG